ncbi:hypothetical protein Ndes2526B_g01991 [Nannochloris sp. 'desiccata']|nr:hypothetical protein NADE_002734 [Chlorella desiccata (nom. nud.)]
MGQICCCPADLSGKERWTKTDATPTIGTLNDLTFDDRAGDSDGEFWEARSFGSMSVYSTTSHQSCLSINDLLDQYQEDLDGDIHDLEEEMEEAAMAGGHLVPKEIEKAATEGMENEAAWTGWFTSFKNKQETVAAETSPVVHVTSLDDSKIATAFPLAAVPLPEFFSSETALKKLQHAKELKSNGRILEAHEMLLNLCEDFNESRSNRSSEDTSQTSFTLSSLINHSTALGIDITALETDVDALHAALSGLEDDTGWMVSRKGELRVLYSHKKGTTQHSLKFHAVFPHPVEHILSLAHEWDLLPTWNKFTLEAIKLAEPSIFESVVYGAQWMMKPFRHMQAIVRARGFDLAASPLHRCLLIMINDVLDTEVDALDLENRYPHLPGAMAKRKRVNILNDSCIKLRPLPPMEGRIDNKNAQSGSDNRNGTNITRRIPRTDAHLMVHLDPHIPYVPSSLVNFVLGILAPYIYNQMLKVLDNAFKEADGEFPKRVRDQPELYGLVEKRMAEFADELHSICE